MRRKKVVTQEFTRSQLLAEEVVRAFAYYQIEHHPSSAEGLWTDPKLKWNNMKMKITELPDGGKSINVVAWLEDSSFGRIEIDINIGDHEVDAYAFTGTCSKPGSTSTIKLNRIARRTPAGKIEVLDPARVSQTA